MKKNLPRLHNSEEFTVSTPGIDEISVWKEAIFVVERWSLTPFFPGCSILLLSFLRSLPSWWRWCVCDEKYNDSAWWWTCHNSIWLPSQDVYWEELNRDCHPRPKAPGLGASILSQWSYDAGRRRLCQMITPTAIYQLHSMTLNHTILDKTFLPWYFPFLCTVPECKHLFLQFHF